MRKTKSKAIIALTIIAAMILSLAVSRVSANDSYKIRFSVSANATENHTIQVVDDGQHLVIDGQYVDAKKANAATPEEANVSFSVADVGNGVYEMTIPNGEEVVLNFYGNNKFDLFANGQPVQSDQTTFSTGTNIAIQDYVAPQQGDQPGDQPQVGGPDNITIDAKFTDTHMIASINGITFMDDAQEFMDSFEGTLDAAGTTDPNETNTFKFINVFGDAPVLEFTINGVTYKEGDENITIGTDGEFTTITVPGAASYTIRGTGDPNAELPRTIIWTNPNYVPRDAADEEWIQEFKLENGYGYVAAVYDEEGNLVDPDTYKSENWTTNENGAGVGSNGFGWINVKPGSKVVFEFYPEYGYQLTDIRINGNKLGLSNLMNSFEFIMPDTNIHFDAEFTKTSDVLKDGSNSIEGGAIELPDGTIDSGTAQLRVNDVDIPADKIKGFENAAGDYSVKTYLDIDLFQVFYKGKDDDEDVWENKLDELEKEATISLKLADGLTADDIVIVHNVHDGDEYEVIKIESYDEATNTITFKTKSFSNYAIATKGDGKKSKSPKAGDRFIIYGIAGAVAVIVLIAVVVKKNKKED
ncbi:MAG: hypothetical protein IKE91_07080 [Clostridia bacterium]|nr:hypothetical protein [Clostridia bacterium]